MCARDLGEGAHAVEDARSGRLRKIQHQKQPGAIAFPCSLLFSRTLGDIIYMRKQIHINSTVRQNRGRQENACVGGWKFGGVACWQNNPLEARMKVTDTDRRRSGEIVLVCGRGLLHVPLDSRLFLTSYSSAVETLPVILSTRRGLDSLACGTHANYSCLFPCHHLPCVFIVCFPFVSYLHAFTQNIHTCSCLSGLEDLCVYSERHTVIAPQSRAEPSQPGLAETYYSDRIAHLLALPVQ